MNHRVRSAVATYRARKAREGFVRLEVSVHEEDAGLVRQVAAALADPARRALARTWLQQQFGEPAPISLKALLASAPLDGIDLERNSDTGRDVAF